MKPPAVWWIFVTDKEEELTIKFAYSGRSRGGAGFLYNEEPSLLYIQAIKKS